MTDEDHQSRPESLSESLDSIDFDSFLEKNIFLLQQNASIQRSHFKWCAT